jgi:hypothetical protein
MQNIGRFREVGLLQTVGRELANYKSDGTGVVLKVRIRIVNSE